MSKVEQVIKKSVIDEKFQVILDLLKDCTPMEVCLILETVRKYFDSVDMMHYLEFASQNREVYGY